MQKEYGTTFMEIVAKEVLLMQKYNRSGDYQCSKTGEVNLLAENKVD